MEGLCVRSSVFCFFLLHRSTFFCTFAESAIKLGNDTDCRALLAFKGGINEDPNYVMSSWNDSAHFCTWVGVTCGKRHQRVTALNLSSHGLVGSLSPHIGNLTFLRVIDLSNNSFQGQIPQEIGRLFRLVSLDLKFNSFSEEIPKNLTHCFQLSTIQFYHNKLVGKIPFELGSLPKLSGLHLGKNNLTGHIPSSLGNISSLVHLHLSWNNLEGSIPNELGRLASLELLAVAVNKLSGTVPSSIYNLSSLSILSVSDNHLRGTLPLELGLTLPNLEGLYFGDNQFTGHIPESLGNASALYLIDFSNNSFIGSMPLSVGRCSRLEKFSIEANHLGGTKDDDLDFITSLTNCSDLQHLFLGNNQFSSMLPCSIANLSTQLQILSLEENQIYGAIPSGIENLASLISLNMDKNQIKDIIPLQLGKLQKLGHIRLDQNELSGQIPTSIGNLTTLNLLSLHGNDLHGPIPWSLGNCKHLEQLWLSSNKLHGVIPKQLFNSPSLRILDVSYNSFSSFLPLEVGTSENLEELYVHGNKLSGEIPNTFGSCIKLQYLHMEDNFFQGIIPPSLSTLKNLKELDLSRNNLAGQIPEYLEELHYLQYLNLSFNDFDGEVPQKGIFQNTSVISITGNVKLCGGIPRLHLRPCPKQLLKKQGRPSSLKTIISIIIPIVFCLSLLSYFIITRWRRKSSKKLVTLSFMKNPSLEVTYAELHRATNGFSLSNLIGMGSYGSVYKGVIDRITTTTVGIKVFNLQQTRSFKSFMVECQALRSVKHRNIVKVLTVCSSIDFEGNDFKALVFEYMPNKSLDMHLHPNENNNHPSRNLSLIQRINIAIDVAYALDYLHHHLKKPLVHCDLKPSNVLLDDNMVAHVSDFGLARMLNDDSINCSHSQSSSSFMRGSIGYIAPEYGMGGDVSVYGDMYSYGILLLEMFLGKKPTDKIFTDNLSITQFAKMALPDRVMEIVDHQLLSEEIEVIKHCEDPDKAKSAIQKCLMSLVRIGLSCSTNSPKERMEMKDVLREMHGIRQIYLNVAQVSNHL